MIRTKIFLCIVYSSLISSLMVCSDNEHGEFAEASVSRSKSHKSSSDSESSDNEQALMPPARRLSPSQSHQLFANVVPKSSLTTTNLPTTVSSLASKAIEENKTSPLQQIAQKRSARSFRRRLSGGSQGSSSSSLAQQTTLTVHSGTNISTTVSQHMQSTSTSMNSSSTTATQEASAGPSATLSRKILGAADSELTLVGAAPVARAETGFFTRLWSTAQPYVQCQRTITETSIKENSFCEKFPTAPSRFAAISGAITELTLQGEQKFDNDYLVRAKTVFIFAKKNNIAVLTEQAKSLLELLRKKQREYAALEQLLTSHTSQSRIRKKSLSESKD